jgi:hypothetical protein
MMSVGSIARRWAISRGVASRRRAALLRPYYEASLRRKAELLSARNTAHRAVKRALRSGELMRPLTCEGCGAPPNYWRRDPATGEPTVLSPATVANSSGPGPLRPQSVAEANQLYKAGSISKEQLRSDFRALYAMYRRKQRAGGWNLQAHHSDIAKPLDVVWLCSKCHATADQLLRKQTSDPIASRVNRLMSPLA